MLLLLATLSHPRRHPTAPSSIEPALSSAQPPLVFTYFYYWYDLPDGAHSTALTDHPVDPSASFRRVDWMGQQLIDMRDAGIDVALAVYWGDEEPSSDVGLANLVQAARQLRAEGERTPGIGLFLDTGLIGRWSYDQRDLRTPENRDRFYALVRRFYQAVPREMWGTIDGRPVLWLWGSWLDIRFDQRLFDDVYTRFEADFGVRPYIVADNSWRYAIGTGFMGRISVDRGAPISVDDFYSWGGAIEGYREEGGNVAEIGPGYDERRLGGSADRTGRYVPRDGGATYRAAWEAALASGKRFIAIETWNEFHEASDIADSREYGRTYIEITREYAGRLAR